MKSILDRSFRYIPSAETDLKKTFARIRREQRIGMMAPVPDPSRAGKVTHLQRENLISPPKRSAPGKL